MPEHRLPIGWMRLRGWTVSSDNIAKADTQEARISREAKGAHSEVLLFGKNFDDGRTGQLQTIPGTEIGFGALQKFQHLRAVNRRFAAAHTDNEVRIGERLKLPQAIVQGAEIVGRNIVAVGTMNFFGEGPDRKSV